jgi:hypothetical protein
MRQSGARQCLDGLSSDWRFRLSAAWCWRGRRSRPKEERTPDGAGGRWYEGETPLHRPLVEALPRFHGKRVAQRSHWPHTNWTSSTWRQWARFRPVIHPHGPWGEKPEPEFLGALAAGPHSACAVSGARCPTTCRPGKMSGTTSAAGSILRRWHGHESGEARSRCMSGSTSVTFARRPGPSTAKYQASSSRSCRISTCTSSRRVRDPPARGRCGADIRGYSGNQPADSVRRSVPVHLRQRPAPDAVAVSRSQHSADGEDGLR